MSYEYPALLNYCITQHPSLKLHCTAIQLTQAAGCNLGVTLAFLLDKDTHTHTLKSHALTVETDVSHCEGLMQSILSLQECFLFAA